MSLRVGYIGIGIMGCGIVKNLRRADVPVAFVVHRDRSRVEELTAVGAVEVPGYAELADESDVVMLTVPDSSVVEPLLLGEDGIGPHLKKGQIVVDMSTSYPASSRVPLATPPLIPRQCASPLDRKTPIKFFRRALKYQLHVGPEKMYLTLSAIGV